MAQTKMADPMDDIAKQARQGSVAAIIQLLNERLADSGVRTRAMFVEGALQLLCEAATPEQLEQSVVVEQIRKILEAIAPRNIRRVNINCRIGREQQLLWLDEISRDPESQLLWSEQIILKKPNIFQQLEEERKHKKFAKNKPPFPKSPHSIREQRVFWRGIAGGVSVSLLLLLAGWGIYQWLSTKFIIQIQPQSPQASVAPKPKPKTAVSPRPSKAPSKAPDKFVEGVRLAEQANAAGKKAKSSVQWLEIAAKWQKASDMMASINKSDKRYKTAKSRVDSYRKNSQTALKEAEKKR